MNSSDEPRRVRCALTRRQLITWSSLSIGAAGAGRAWALDGEEGISRSAEAIHQEPSFSASAHAVYEALTDEKQFERFMALSEAVQSKAIAPQPVRIDARAGGAFSVFGGYISGRFLELVPDQLIVQAWRTGSWGRGIYSIARFELLSADHGQSKIRFDHTGFPKGQAAHLASGWQVNYWEPMGKLIR
jgi:uncharacterized protein YndB with AHSA1/START domain